MSSTCGFREDFVPMMDRDFADGLRGEQEAARRFFLELQIANRDRDDSDCEQLQFTNQIMRESKPESEFRESWRGVTEDGHLIIDQVALKQLYDTANPR